MPDETRLFTGHSYRSGGRAPGWESSLAEQRAHSSHLQVVDAAEYVALSQARDAELPVPDRMFAALQISLRGGQRPPAEGNGSNCLKIPLDRFQSMSPGDRSWRIDPCIALVQPPTWHRHAFERSPGSLGPGDGSSEEALAC